jgi:hypothetical protein
METRPRGSICTVILPASSSSRSPALKSVTITPQRLRQHVDRPEQDSPIGHHAKDGVLERDVRHCARDVRGVSHGDPR